MHAACADDDHTDQHHNVSVTMSATCNESTMFTALVTAGGGRRGRAVAGDG